MNIDKNELASNNGKDSKPSYIAVNGKVYNVSESRLWKNGIHMNRHEAGKDLSNDLSIAPHGTEVFNKFTQVATMKKSDEEDALAPVPAWLNKFLKTYPFFKRHPHPMVVHFPMTFFITAPLFLSWYYLVNSIQSLLDAILYMHILSILSLPVAIGTGWLSWKVNYLGKPISNITRKLIFSIIILIFNIIVLITITNDLTILSSPAGIQIIIPIIIFSYLPIVAYIGQQGGDLVY